MLKAILQAKCPRCRTGDMFLSSVFRINKFYKMHESCSNCQLKFEIEPGFFFGAMYINYGFTIANIATVAIILNVFNSYTLIRFTVTVITSILFLLPVFFRYSRVLFLYLFGNVKHQKPLTK